jgi:hypothetical protein
MFHPVVRVQLKLEQFVIVNGDTVSALLLSHHQACAVS